MTKITKNISFLLFSCLLMVTGLFNLKALTSITVNDETELLNALKDEKYDTIELGKDINTTQKINITREVTIDGHNHTLKYTGKFNGTDDFKTWAGIYVLQVYKVSATIKDIKLTGGNAGLLINGADVELAGTIDVSGNGFGGIELGQGVDVKTTPKIELDKDVNLVNTTETKDSPTLWADETTGTIEVDGMTQALNDGEDLSVSEIETIFNMQDNPMTSDNIVLYFLLTGILSITLLLSVKKFNIYNN